jgi:hypothetical protein
MKHALVLLTCLASVAVGNELANPGFESGQGGIPDGWRRYAGQPTWDTTQSHAGEGSAKLVSGGLQDGMGLVQVIEYEHPDTRPIIIGGWSRAEGVGATGDFSVYLDVFYADGTPWWARTAEWPRGTHDWAYAASIHRPAKPVRRIEVYVLLRKCQGTAWVDDVFLERGGLHVTGLGLRRDAPRHPRRVQLDALLSGKAKWQAELATPDGHPVANASGQTPSCQVSGEIPAGCTRLLARIRGRAADGQTLDFTAPLSLPALPKNPVREGYAVWTATGMEQILPDAFPPVPLPEPRIELQLARGEHEGAQLAVRTADSVSLHEVRLAIDPVPAAGGQAPAGLAITPLVVGYVRVDTSSGHPAFGGKTGWFPDPLLPHRPVDVLPGCTQAFWLDAHASPDTPPGVYRTTVRLRAAGQPPIAVPVAIRVRSFRLPTTPGMKTAFCLMDGFLRQTYGTITPDRRRQALDIMLDHRLNPDDISRYEPPRVDDLLYANQRGLNAFNILNVVPRPKGSPTWVCYSGKEAYTPAFTADFLARAKPVVAELRRHGLADKAYFYGFDERREDYDEIIRGICQALKQRFPEVKTFTTATHMFEKRRTVPLDYQDYMDWYCPLTPRYDSELAARLRTVGKQVWWYVCCGPKYPYANFATVDYPTIEGRLLAWFTYRYQADGLLYWHVNYWAKNPIIDTWREPYLDDWSLPCIARMTGDGVLVYPLADGLASSLRLEAVRDGSEDYDLLAAVAAKLGTERTDALLQTMVRGMTDFDRDPQALNRIRAKLFDALED